jgi:hypothetical protein
LRSTLVKPSNFIDVDGKELAAKRESKLADKNVETAAVATMYPDPFALSPNYLELKV